MKKKIVFMISLISLLLILTGCSIIRPPYQNDNDAKIDIVKKDFKNCTDAFNVKDRIVDIYYLDNSAVSYIDIKDFFNLVDGVYKYNHFNFSFNRFADSINIYWFDGLSMLTLTINWFDNTITLNSKNFLNNVYEQEFYNYDTHVYNSRNVNPFGLIKIVYDLNEYDLDILFYKSHCLVPLSIINTIILAENYYSIVEFDDHLRGYYAVDIDEIPDYHSSKSTFTIDELNYNYQYLAFIFKEFYGLQNIRDVKQVLSDNQNLIISSDMGKVITGLVNIFNYDLNDLHTSFIGYNLYQSIFNKFDMTLVHPADRLNNFFDTMNYLQELRSLAGVSDNSVRYYLDTAIITMNSFMLGTIDEIYDTDDQVKDDAYLYDTFTFLKKAMDEITSKNEIKNIILDLSLNGGGVVHSAIQTLGFMNSKEVVMSTHDYRDDSDFYSYYKVDTNLDGKYDNLDGYSNYNWYILSSACTFSAANFVVALAIASSTATVIGQTSGGGMCSVYPVNLPIGYSAQISGPQALFVTIDNKKIEIEDGLDPNIFLDYHDFYNDEALYNLIH